MLCLLVGRSQKCKCPIFQQSIANYSLFYLEDDEKEEEEEEKEDEEGEGRRSGKGRGRGKVGGGL